MATCAPSVPRLMTEERARTRTPASGHMGTGTSSTSMSPLWSETCLIAEALLR